MLKGARINGIRPQGWMIHALGGTVALAVAAGLYGGIFAPLAADVDHRTARMAHLHLLMANSQRIAAEHRELTERLATLRQAAATVRKRMPRRASSQEFVQRASDAASAFGLHMEHCAAAAAQETPTHSQVEVTCRVTGSFDSVCRYLAAVDQFPQISKISTLAIESATNSEGYPVQLVFQLYYRSEVNDTEVKRGTL